MKRILPAIALAAGLSTVAANAQSRFVTLFTTNGINTSYLTLNTNETGRLVDGWLDKVNKLRVFKNGQEIYSQSVGGGLADTPTNMRPVTIAGPASFFIVPQSSYFKSYCTIEVIPDSTSFSPDKTLILPEGTVGIVHVESSTNLVQWQDEWVHTFSNTNQNRFFRIRAERSLQ